MSNWVDEWVIMTGWGHDKAWFVDGEGLCEESWSLVLSSSREIQLWSPDFQPVSGSLGPKGREVSEDEGEAEENFLC